MTKLHLTLLCAGLLCGCGRGSSPQVKFNLTNDWTIHDWYTTNLFGMTNPTPPVPWTPFEQAMIAGTSNGTYEAMCVFNKEHSICNAPPALTYNPTNPIGAFFAQYIDYVFTNVNK